MANAASAWRPLVGALAALSVRVLPDSIDVDLPRGAIEPQLPLTLGLFMQASLDLAASDGATTDSHWCTAAAVAWRCLEPLTAAHSSGSSSVVKVANMSTVDAGGLLQGVTTTNLSSGLRNVVL